MATLLPNGRQTVYDANGAPLVGGSVYMYVPASTVLKDTWQDSGASILNTNPIILDDLGSAVIYGAGIYRQVIYDRSGNLIWDALTASTDVGGISWGGVSAGTVNAQTATFSGFNEQDGQQVAFIAGLTNTNALTVNGISVLKDTLSGPAPLSGGEVTQNNAVEMIYELARGAFHLVAFPGSSGGTGQLTNIAGAATIDLGTIASHLANVTGSGWTCTSFGSSAGVSSPLYTVKFVSTGTITYNGTSLITPTGGDISVKAGNAATLLYLGSGNWQILSFTYSNLNDIAGIVPTTGGLIYWNGTNYVQKSIGTTGQSLVVRGGVPTYDTVATLATAKATTSGTAIDFTGIPSWVTHVELTLSGVSTSGTNAKIVQIGSGSVQASGYVGSYGYFGSSEAATTTSAGMGINSLLAADTLSGIVTLTLLDKATHVWTMNCVLSANTNFIFASAASVALSGDLDRIRLTTFGASDTFDAGVANIAYF